ncbi:growth arrest-specific protein 1b [Hoplias malabaricus]|uniref:growth arrest-specific protein 1b n=1 Tax=Hoplias malabaricus TaxID=27720 RepID=UPI003461FFAD
MCYARGHRDVVLLLAFSVTFTAVVAATSVHAPLCWQAILLCQSEPECRYAYAQYAQACGSVLLGRRRSCPSHCVSSLVQLNLTAIGPTLERCHCAHDDAVCNEAKRAIEPCVPRTSVAGAGGCTEARRECQRDLQCAAAAHDFLQQCRGLFASAARGREDEGACTEGCRVAIARMRAMPKARPLDTCVCDGAERTICESVKASMRTLCFGATDAGSGFFSDYDDHLRGIDDEDDEDYVAENYAKADGENLVLLATCVASVLTRFS